MAWPWGRRAAGGARTVAIGDVHGGLDELRVLLDRIPPLTKRDTIVFLGDYLDRGPDPAGVIDHIRHVLPRRTRAKLVCLRGNHEDAWLRVIDQGWPEFLLPSGNGCLMTLLSFRGRREEGVGPQDFEALLKGSFFPPDVVEWLRGLGARRATAAGCRSAPRRAGTASQGRDARKTRETASAEVE